jgi:hypothetical protein
MEFLTGIKFLEIQTRHRRLLSLLTIIRRTAFGAISIVARSRRSS